MISPKVDFRCNYDIEAGLSSPGRYARRFIARRARWIAGAVIAAIVVLLLSDFGHRGSRRETDWQGQAEDAEEGNIGELEDIWEGQIGEESVGKEGGWGWGFGLPFGGKPVVSPATDTMTISGDDGKGGDHSAIDDYIAPMHPDLSILPSPSEIFAEVNIHSFLSPPTLEPFPEERLREVISNPPDEGVSIVGGYRIPDDAYSKQWVGPHMWDQPRGEIKRVQWEGFDGERVNLETTEQRDMRKERREAVRRGFVWAWQAYKDNAWGKYSPPVQGIQPDIC